jgi:type II secretory pathway component PulF
MAKVDDPRLPGWDEPPRPLKSKGGRSGKRPAFGQLSLIQIMLIVLFASLLFWALKQILESDGYLEKILFGVLVGLGFGLTGLWCVLKLARFSVLGWILFVLGYFSATAVTTGGLAILSLPILVGAIIFLCVRRHANNQDALLWVLEVAADRGIPLAPGVDAFSSQVTGMYQVWVGSLADLLGRGEPLPDALDRLPKLVPRRSALMVRMGWESGNLAIGLREAGTSRETRQPILAAVGGRMAYLGWVATFGTFIVGFIVYFIVPKFEAIFRDFGLMLPEMTRLVITTSHVLVDYFWIGVLVVLGAITYGMVALLGPGDFSLPVVDRLFVRRHTVTILRALAVVVSADRPIGPFFYGLSQWYPTGWVRRKLNQAALDAALGVDWTQALRDNGLLSASDVGVLTAAQRAGNLAWALRELAETGERRWAYRLQVWSQLLFVLTMLVFGGVVFLLAVAFFLPLVTLIERLAS